MVGPVSTLVVCLKSHVASQRHDGNDGKRTAGYGFDVEIKILALNNWLKIVKNIDFLHGAYNRGLDSNNIERIHGYATFWEQQLKSMGQNIRRRTF